MITYLLLLGDFMKKIIFPKFSKIALIISTILIAIYSLLTILKKFNIYIYFLGIGTHEFIPFITIPCAILLISAITVLLYKNFRHKILAVLLAVIISFFTFSYMLVDAAFSPSSKYFEYTSDDKKHSIVVNEQSFLLSGGGAIYEKTSFCTMKWVGGYSTDDGFCPFSNDAFFFVWNENDFELHYDFFADPDAEYKVVKMEYVK